MATIRHSTSAAPRGRRREGAERGGSSVGEILRTVVDAHPDTQSQLFAADGGLNRYVNVYLNDEDVRVLDGLETAVGDSRHARDPAGDGGRAH